MLRLAVSGACCSTGDDPEANDDMLVVDEAGSGRVLLVDVMLDCVMPLDCAGMVRDDELVDAATAMVGMDEFLFNPVAFVDDEGDGGVDG